MGEHIVKRSIPGFPGYRIDQFGTVYGRKGAPVAIRRDGCVQLYASDGSRRAQLPANLMRAAGFSVREAAAAAERKPDPAPAPASADNSALTSLQGVISQLRAELAERTESLRLAREVNRHLISRMRSLEAQVKAAVHGKRVEPREPRDLYEDVVPPEIDDYDAIPAWRNA